MQWKQLEVYRGQKETFLRELELAKQEDERRKNKEMTLKYMVIGSAFISILCFILLIGLFGKQLPVEVKPYDPETIQVGDYVELELNGTLELFELKKTHKDLRFTTTEAAYWLGILESGDTFLGKTSLQKVPKESGKYYGHIIAYDKTINEFLNNPNKTFDNSILDMADQMEAVMKEAREQGLSSTDMFDQIMEAEKEAQKNFIYENKELMLSLFGKYEIVVTKEQPTEKDPRSVYAYLIFLIPIAMISARYFIKKRDQ